VFKRTLCGGDFDGGERERVESAREARTAPAWRVVRGGGGLIRDAGVFKELKPHVCDDLDSLRGAKPALMITCVTRPWVRASVASQPTFNYPLLRVSVVVLLSPAPSSQHSAHEHGYHGRHHERYAKLSVTDHTC
jgi:hypothetical protein